MVAARLASWPVGNKLARTPKNNDFISLGTSHRMSVNRDSIMSKGGFAFLYRAEPPFISTLYLELIGGIGHGVAGLIPFKDTSLTSLIE